MMQRPTDTAPRREGERMTGPGLDHVAQIEPDFDESWDFCERLRPTGPHAITTIANENKGIRGSLFRPGEKAQFVAFCQRAYDLRENTYYSLNSVIPSQFHKKAKKVDIAEVIALHVDDDPEKGKDLDRERARILKRAQHDLPAGVPQVSIIVDSGGGYQLIWLLDAPIVINGDLAKAADTERYTRWLEQRFEGSDKTHNVDRVLRLPGTCNFPNLKKQAKGRFPRRARVVQWL
tara:strand:+ start:3227 stop:3928 length:702 start_codon:yes stop_codon:yes gene_type:complete